MRAHTRENSFALVALPVGVDALQDSQVGVIHRQHINRKR